MRKPKLTRLELLVQRDYLASVRADYPEITAKEFRATKALSTHILIDARKQKRIVRACKRDS